MEAQIRWRAAIKTRWLSCGKFVEAISKLSEEDNEAGKLDEAEEVVGVIFPADEDATLPLDPGEKALDQPASHVPA